MGKLSYVCAECSEHFTRKTSGKRHNINLHYGRAEIVPLMEYLVGRGAGKYLPSHPSWFRRGQKVKSAENGSATTADSTQGMFKLGYEPTIVDRSKITNRNYMLENASFEQPVPVSGYTRSQLNSEDYSTLQKKFRFNLVFPNYLPIDTMRGLLELESLLLKFSDYHANPSQVIQYAIDQYAKGDNTFLKAKLNQLRYMDSLKK